MSAKEQSSSARNMMLMFIAFLGIFVYGLLTALPGTVLPELERHGFLPNDGKVGTFLLINAIGAVISYSVSGPLTDRLGKKYTLWVGSVLVIVSMAAFAVIVASVPATSALAMVFACGLVLGLGANAIVVAGHALVGDIAEAQRNAALNLLDVFFGLGLFVLPQIARAIPGNAGLGTIFWVLAGFAVAFLIMVLSLRFPKPSHPESFPMSEAGELFRSTSFWLLAIALFMYVGSEVAVGKWVVTFLEKDSRLLAASGANVGLLRAMRPDALTDYFKRDPEGVARFALWTLSLFGFALMVGRLISSFLLRVTRIKSITLLVAGSAVTTVALAFAFNAGTPMAVRIGIIVSGIGMGPIFPTSVGLASVIQPRISGTAMSWVMGIGFAGLLAIPPAVGYISEAFGGEAGDVRKGLLAVLTASAIMLFLHLILSVSHRSTRSLEAKEAVAARAE